MATTSQKEPFGAEKDTTAASALLMQAVLAKAASFARKGRYAAAESALAPLQDFPAALDMLARMRAQQGRFADAEGLWTRALQLDPGNRGYMAGLRRIADLQRRAPWNNRFALAGAAVIVLLSAWMIWTGVQDSCRQSRKLAAEEKVVPLAAPCGQPCAAPAAAKETCDTATTAVPEPVAAAVVPKALPFCGLQAAIQADGFGVVTQQETLVVAFSNGLFQSGALLTRDAQQALSKLAGHLKVHVTNMTVRVIGCTDNTAVQEGWVFPDNESLGMARAVAVVDHFRTRCGLPSTMFIMQSVGGAWTPYPNDTLENQFRNRTVVIRLCLPETFP